MPRFTTTVFCRDVARLVSCASNLDSEPSLFSKTGSSRQETRLLTQLAVQLERKNPRVVESFGNLRRYPGDAGTWDNVCPCLPKWDRTDIGRSTTPCIGAWRIERRLCDHTISPQGKRLICQAGRLYYGATEAFFTTSEERKTSNYFGICNGINFSNRSWYTGCQESMSV